MRKFFRCLVLIFSKKFRNGKIKTLEIAKKSFLDFVSKNKLKIKNFNIKELVVGITSRIEDSGNFVVEAVFENGSKKEYMVKINTKIKHRNLFYHPALFTKLQYHQDADHRQNLVKKAWIAGIPVLNYLYVDPQNRLLIHERTIGRGIAGGLSIDPLKVYRFMREAGKGCAQLHKLDLIHGDLKPESHFLMDFQNNKLTIIDLEKIKEAKNESDFIEELKYIQTRLNRKAIPKKHLINIWKNFIEGYKEEWPKSEKIISQIKPPKRNIFMRGFLQTWDYLDDWLRIISRGRLKF